MGIINISITFTELFFTISIKDTGIGIPTDIQEQIFKPFTQFNVQPNQGLGLVELLNGEITLVSNKDIGSTFNIKLPNLIQHLKALNVKRVNLNVMVVDDSIMVLKTINIGITTIIECNYGIECINFINKIDKKIDLIFMDTHMPNMNGLEAIKTIRSMPLKTQPFIVL